MTDLPFSHVIHIGADWGQEASSYAAHGLSVTWIEAREAVMPRLTEHLSHFSDQRAFHATLSDGVQDRAFYIASNGQSSSIYPMALHALRFPEVSMVDQHQCTTTTLDALVAEHGIQTTDTALVMDVQGAELDVLKGASEALRHVCYIKAEAADFNSYEGGAQLAEIDDYLKAKGFERFVLAECEPTEGVGNYYEVGYRRAR